MRNRILFLLCFLCVGLQAFAQISISGKVVDAGGLELPGVNVMVKGTTIGTLTDGDGKFTIPDVPGGSNAVLVFSYVGFQTQEIKVGNAKNLTVKLQKIIWHWMRLWWLVMAHPVKKIWQALFPALNWMIPR